MDGISPKPSGFRYIWIVQRDIPDMHIMIRERGTLESEKEEDPRETGMPFSLVRTYALPGGGSAEAYFSDPCSRRPDDIRLKVVASKEEEQEYNGSRGFRSGDPVRDTRSDTLSPYMRYAMERAFGLLRDWKGFLRPPPTAVRRTG